MKKIGIWTFHRSINYGAFMQAFSLSKNIKRRFPDATVEIVDYTSRIMEDIYRPRLTLSTLKHPIGSLLKSRQYRKFKGALKSLPLSAKSICSDGNTDEVLRAYQNEYDLFVVGSDAVWNWCRRGFPNPYLLHFEGPVAKMSYAASAYGMRERFVEHGQAAYFAESLREFSFIGVRDRYTADLVAKVSPESVSHFTPDPTVLLDMDDVYGELGMTREEFKAYIYKKYRIPTGKKLIGVMGAPNDMVAEIKKKYQEDYMIVSLYHTLRGADRQIVDLTPFEWAAIFGLFEVTVTSYFHGTLLSLRNHVPVINVDFTEFSKQHEGKICDVMRRMDLSECHFAQKGKTPEMMERLGQVLASRTDYVEKIKANLAELSKASTAFFEKMEELLR